MDNMNKFKTGLLVVAAFLFTLWAGSCEQNTFQEGERLYKIHCANCHMDDGIGLSALSPPLAGSDYLNTHREQLPCVLRHGLSDTILVNGKLYAEKMPGVPTLSDINISNILNFINTSWGNRNEVYRLEEVRAALEKCE